jgi:hypothetical protein
MDPEEGRIVVVDMRGELEEDELLTGTPVVTEVSTSHMTISNKSVTTAEREINGALVPAGQAVIFKIKPNTADLNDSYRFKIAVDTNSTPVQNLVAHIVVRIKE